MRILTPIFASTLLLIAVSAFTSAHSGWGTDFETAKEQASAEGKHILLSFSGSDWCANCIRLEKTLFESEEFKAYATENLILLHADFPMRKQNKLSKNQTAHNEMLAEKYNKKGVFPTVILLDAKGNELMRLDHPKETVGEYMSQIRQANK